MAKSVLQGLKRDVPNVRLTRLFEENLQCMNSDQEAIVDGNLTLTYAALNAQANLVARSLVRCLHFENMTNINGKATYIVGIDMEPSASRLVTMLAILKAGAAYVPLDESLPISKLKYMINNSDACAVIASDETVLTSLTCTLQGSAQVLDYNALLSSALSAGESDQDLDEKSELTCGKTGRSIAAIFYTSGTTGKPKVVPITHHNILNAVPNVVEFIDASAAVKQASIYNFLSIVFPVDFFSALLSGRTLVIFPEESKRDVSLMIRLLQALKVNFILSLTPTLLANILTVAQEENINPFKDVLCIGSGAEIVSPIVIRNFLNVTKKRCKLVVIWGMTETTMFSITTPYSSWQDLDDKVYKGKAPMGKPITNMNIYILNKDNEVVPEGEIGQIVVSGDTVTQGYIFAMNTSAFIDNPMELDDLAHRNTLLTGDFGFIKDDMVYFVGRNISQIKIRGYRISTVEIDDVVMSVPGVVKAATIAHKIKDDDVIIVSYFTRQSDSSVDEAAILSHCKKTLPEYAIPRLFLLDELPLRIPQMKVDYPALQEMFQRHIHTDNLEVESSELSLDAIKNVLSRSLGIRVDDITPDMNFFDIGGNSANGVSVWSQLLQYGYTGSLAEFLSTQTISSLLEKSAVDIAHGKFYVQPMNELNIAEQDQVCQFIVASFYNNRYELFNEMFPYSLQVYQAAVTSAWPIAKLDNMSYVIRNKNTKKYVAAGFITTENADIVAARASGTEISGDALLEQVEGPFMKAVPSLPGKTLFGSRFATDPQVLNSDAAILSELSFEHSIAVAKANGFARFHVASMIPSLQVCKRETTQLVLFAEKKKKKKKMIRRS